MYIKSGSKSDNFNSWIQKINVFLENSFPDSWKKSDVEFFIKDNQYSLDLSALNKNLNSPIRYFLKTGGKRIRPILFITCLKIFDLNYEKYIDIAALLELVHNGTLILDDIEDGSQVRRNKPTCHVKYGLDSAVNTGASLYVIPLNYIFENKNIQEKSKYRMVKIYCEELQNISFGQAIDIYWHKDPKIKVTKNKYLEMVRLKTGSLMRMSVRFACALADIDEQTANYFSRFAESIGMAFQIRDDILDIANNIHVFGKAYGNDITEGKLSLPVVIAINKLPEEQSIRLKEILNMHTRNRKLIKEAIDLIKGSNALFEANRTAKNMVNKAWKGINQKWMNKSDLTDLKLLADFFVERKY